MIIPTLMRWRRNLWTLATVRGREKPCVLCNKKIQSGERALRPLTEGHGVVRNQRVCATCASELASGCDAAAPAPSPS